MGSVIGGLLAKADGDVVLVDVWREAVETINRDGLRIDDPAGNTTATIRVRAETEPAKAGVVDLLIVFVKCYHTRLAVEGARPMIGPETTVLSLQNGWGNGPIIEEIVGRNRVLLGVCYHSATVAGPGHVLHVGRNKSFIGEWNGAVSPRVDQIAGIFNRAGIETIPTGEVMREIWAKLALNACTLPTSALLRFYAPQLVQHAPMLELMQALLREVVAVAETQGAKLDFDERWRAITGLLEKCAPTAKGSMLQDVEKGRRTEIDVINGAVVAAGQAAGIATPYNDAMLCLVKSLEQSFGA